jgi:hypothetical protein
VVLLSVVWARFSGMECPCVNLPALLSPSLFNGRHASAPWRPAYSDVNRLLLGLVALKTDFQMFPCSAELPLLFREMVVFETAELGRVSDPIHCFHKSGGKIDLSFCRAHAVCRLHLIKYLELHQCSFLVQRKVYSSTQPLYN